MSLYPWQKHDWQQICHEFSSIPNAWLITGAAGIGKTIFAKYLAQALLCDEPQEDLQPCANCRSCRWFTSGNHPDYRLITPDSLDDKDKSATRKLPIIKVETVRNVIDFAQTAAHADGRKIIVIEPAEAMNMQAANALLKVLEEPLSKVVFILVSHQRERLLPTIKSRCRQYRLSSPSKIQALQWLEDHGIANAQNELAHHGGSPLFADDSALRSLRDSFIEMLQQPRLMLALQLAEQIERQKLTLSLPLDWLNKWLIDLVALRLGRIIRYHPHNEVVLHELAARLDLTKLFIFYDKSQALVLFGQHTLNVRLQLEGLLIEYLRLFTK